MMNSLKLLLINQHQDHVMIIKKAKIQISHTVWISILWDLITHVTSFALLCIVEQYKMLILEDEFLTTCKHIYLTFMKLSYVHQIQMHIYNVAENEVLKLKNIHSHWWFNKFTVIWMKNDIKVTAVFINSLLLVQNLTVMKLKNQSVEAQDRENQRCQEKHENSTQQNLSQFEHVLTKIKMKRR